MCVEEVAVLLGGARSCVASWCGVHVVCVARCFITVRCMALSVRTVYTLAALAVLM